MDISNMYRKKTLLLAATVVVCLATLLIPKIFRPATKKDLPAIAMNTRGQADLSALYRDSVDSNSTTKEKSPLTTDINTHQTKSESRETLRDDTRKPILTKTKYVTDDVENRHEVTHIEFLKVHKAASSTTQSIILRFGLKRNLSFVIPTPTHYLSKEKYFFSDIWPSLPTKQDEHQVVGSNILSNDKYDILSYHMIFNYKKVSSLLHNDAFYVAIVREPFDLFVSAAFYYKFKPKYPYLRKLSNETFLTDLIRNPEQNEATTMAESMTFNSMAYDFGMERLSMWEEANNTEKIIADFLDEIGDIFQLVMVVDKFEESLVLLKRYLNWSLQDVLYTKINTFNDTGIRPEDFNITADDKELFRKRNKYDYKLYDFFKARLEEQISREENFMEEVLYFKRILHDVQQFCSNITDELKAKDKTKKQKSDDVLGDEEKGVYGGNIWKLHRNTKITNYTLSKSIKWIVSSKQVSQTQEKDLYTISKDSTVLKIPTWRVLKLLPLLFDEKEGNTSKTKLLIQQSKWNEPFYVTSRDCILMTTDIMSLYEIVKRNHLKILIENKFGNNFSVIDALKYVSTFT